MPSILVGRMDKVKGLLVTRGTEGQEKIVSRSPSSMRTKGPNVLISTYSAEKNLH